MSFLTTIRSTPDTGLVLTYKFPTGNTDTTNLLNPGTPTAFDIRTYLRQIGKLPSYNITTRLTIVVPNGATIGSSYVTMPALTIANFKNRDSVKLIVESGGYIIGAGGAVGAGGPNNTKGNDGGPGGHALSVASYCTIINNGSIYGGGGGGSGGGAYHANAYNYSYDYNCVRCCSSCDSLAATNQYGQSAFNKCQNGTYCGCSDYCCGTGCHNGGCCSNDTTGCKWNAYTNRIYDCIQSGTATADAVDTPGESGGRGAGFNQTRTDGTAATGNEGAGGNGGAYGANGTAGGNSTYNAGAVGTAGNSLIGKSFVNSGTGISGTVTGTQS